MGKTGGQSKARTTEQARASSRARWDRTEEEKKAKTPLEAQADEPESLEEELAQEVHRRTFVQPLKKKTVEQTEQEFTKLRTLAGVRQPKRKPKN